MLKSVLFPPPIGMIWCFSKEINLFSSRNFEVPGYFVFQADCTLTCRGPAIAGNQNNGGVLTLINSDLSFQIRFRYSFICRGTSTKVEVIPLSALPKDITSELAGLSPHYPFYAERQAGKL